MQDLVQIQCEFIQHKFTMTVYIYIYKYYILRIYNKSLKSIHCEPSMNLVCLAASFATFLPLSSRCNDQKIVICCPILVSLFHKSSFFAAAYPKQHCFKKLQRIISHSLYPDNLACVPLELPSNDKFRSRNKEGTGC